MPLLDNAVPYEENLGVPVSRSSHFYGDQEKTICGNQREAYAEGDRIYRAGQLSVPLYIPHTVARTGDVAVWLCSKVAGVKTRHTQMAQISQEWPARDWIG